MPTNYGLLTHMVMYWQRKFNLINTYQNTKKFIFMKKFITTMFSFNGYCYTEHGKATYYSKTCTRKAANGERISPHKMTCAHKTLPFGTMVKVTNKNNNKSVVVKVTDRGPFGKGRIVDLSWGAAESIDMLIAGVVPVVIEVIGDYIDGVLHSDKNTKSPKKKKSKKKRKK